MGANLARLPNQQGTRLTYHFKKEWGGKGGGGILDAYNFCLIYEQATPNSENLVREVNQILTGRSIPAFNNEKRKKKTKANASYGNFILVMWFWLLFG